MISVLLTLLKILGIVLLVLIGLFLLIILVVLFVPVRYRIKGYYKEQFVCRIKATWLLHMVTITLDYEKELLTSFKVLGIDISSFFNKKENTNSKVERETNSSNKKTETEDFNNRNKELHDSIKEREHSPEIAQAEKKPATDSSSGSSRNIFQKIWDFIDNTRNKVISIYQKIQEIIINIKEKKDSLERYIRILQKKEVKGAFSLCKKRLIKMIKHLLPRHMRIHVHAGMDDPSVTGYILGAYSMLSDKLRRQIILQADFEEVILEADYTIKGHCHAIVFLHEILCIVTDKNCRSFYKLVKKEIINERK